MCTYTSALFDTENVGGGKTVTVQGIAFANALDAQNFTLTTNTATSTGEITGIPLTISGVVEDKEYDGTTTGSVTYAVSGVQAGDTVVVSGGTATFVSGDAGLRNVEVTGYSITGPSQYSVGNASFTTQARISPRVLTLTPTTVDKMYDGSREATVSIATDKVAGDDVNVLYTSALFGDKNVGSNKIVTISGLSLMGQDAQNYSFTSTTLTTSASIMKRTLTATPVASNKVYDGTTASSVRFTDNRADQDDVRVTASTTFADKHVGVGKAVTIGTPTLDGLDAGNYTLAVSSAPVTADITKAPVSVSFTALNKVYDRTTAATIAIKNLAGVVGTDDVTLSDGTAVFINALVGTGKAVTASGFTLSGTDAANYEITTVGTATADITAKPLTLTITASNKVVDGNATATLATQNFSGVVAGDTVSVTAGTLSFVDSSLGTAKAVMPSGFTLAGAHKDNYTLTIASPITANITAVPVVVSSGGGGGGGGGGGFFGVPITTNVTTTAGTITGGISPTPANVTTTSGSSVQTNGRVLGASNFKFTKTLRKGSKIKPDVLELQKILIARGFLAADNATGFFGNMTLAAVKQYQTANKIEATGIVGPLTRAALNAGK
jgi:hypothetical protein